MASTHISSCWSSAVLTAHQQEQALAQTVQAYLTVQACWTDLHASHAGFAPSCCLEVGLLHTTCLLGFMGIALPDGVVLVRHVQLQCCTQ